MNELDPPCYAALDLGSNNCRLLIAKPNKDLINDPSNSSPEQLKLNILDAFSRSVRLGEGVRINKRLSPAAMSRARDCLLICSRKILATKPKKIRAIATEACRQASNARDFLNLIESQFNIPFEIISPQEEALLAWRGCLPLASPTATHLIVFDIGGASTQIIFAKRQENHHWKWIDWISVEEGVITLFDRVGASLLNQNQFDQWVIELKQNFIPFYERNNLSDLLSNPNTNVEMIGTSGTVTTLCGAVQGLETYSREKVDGAKLSYNDARRLMLQLAKISPEERVQVNCIGADRTHLMVAGCLLLDSIWQGCNLSKLTVADRGLREGILCELMKEDGYHV